MHHKHKKQDSKAKHDSKDAEIKELKDTLQRLQADFENTLKRIERQKQDFIEIANAQMILELLPMLDSFESAEQKIGSGKENPKEGIELLHKQFSGILQRHGLEKINAKGKKFDALCHEISGYSHDPKQEDSIITEEVQKGFLLKGKLLRAAKVKINKKTEE
ncbi:MAG: nucleotide exchange factor GrpE [Candidatus Diapherotrites archaeon]|nr:nucleotide exchange factor GrpE [Candidatus Diapherotrites archaeon]